MKRINDWYDDDDYQYYSSLDEVIEEVKAANEKSGGWIWENGKIRDDVFVCDVIQLLESLRDCEVRLSKKTFNNILENGKVDNTYNWGANISNDLNLGWIDGKGCLIRVHLGGDVRGNYSNYFSIESLEDLYEAEGMYQYKAINERYSADMECFREGFEVYDNDEDDTIGECYEMELDDVLEWIDKKTSGEEEE